MKRYYSRQAKKERAKKNNSAAKNNIINSAAKDNFILDSFEKDIIKTLRKIDFSDKVEIINTISEKAAKKS